MNAHPELVLDIFPGLFPAGGIGRYVRDLCAALRTISGGPSYRFAYPYNLRAVARERYRADELIELPYGWRRMRLVCVASCRLGLPMDRLLGEPALFHSPLGYGPLVSQARGIVHVHDLTFVDHPEWHPFRTTFFLQNTVPIAARRAKRVICHSEWVKAETVRGFGVDPARITVIPPPIGHDFHPIPRAEAEAHVHARFGLSGPYLLHVGTIEPRKNHSRIISAFEGLRQEGFPGPLVLVGRDGWRIGPILARLESSPARAHIMRVSDASEADLVALYGASTGVVFPSLEEGFGMPILEAMACATPCLTGDRTAMAEVGRDFALFVTPEDEGGILDGMRALWKDAAHRERAQVVGPPRAEAYRLERWAGRTFELYRSELAVTRGSAAAADP